ncbi:D-alanine--D-alanine ligase family protein [Deinococcus maricopensis]|uniref:D-alanine--D-alanine ligase n=1 Tax=Deinococcus maricopensis (strain DSM 21211 / LMG 22137 / NRRL B-23946 / LB-34) TaxID=709986 RepID=E8UBP4_DEIML|nr:D-alanine--D-alanine ligase family protein [Deinococcus maricopensis]ADV68483.1 D-alanine--D-alanine ligase [Deinococcus maricopensis DSM 21211]
MSDGAKVRILLLAGGQSGEHEVSLSSARGVLAALPKDRFEVTPLVISKEGRWLPPADTTRALEAGVAETGGDLMLRGVADAASFDVVFPLLHGPNGEDGTVQGLLTLAGIPFVGSGVLGSAASMDKAMTKQVLAAHGIPQVPWRLLTRAQVRRDPAAALTAARELGFPLFVKPANMGSSVGISKVRGEDELDGALREAFAHDRRVVLEAMTQGKPRELEVGILGNDAPMASPVGELRFDADFYDYETKYTEGRATMHIPADVPHAVAEQVRTYALAAFRALDCAGLARIDFFYEAATGQVYLNEVNTMPGFTPTSMYPNLWAAAGLSYADLVTRLVELATEDR